MTLKIPIIHNTKGTYTMLLDDDDYDKIKDLRLTLNYTSNKNTNYVYTKIYEKSKYIKTIHIHRLVMGLDDYKKDNRIVNHINGNGLDNRKENLEICNTIYNSQSINWKNTYCKHYYFENDPKRKSKWRVGLKIYGTWYRKRFMTEQECIEYIDSLYELRTDKKIVDKYDIPTFLF